MKAAPEQQLQLLELAELDMTLSRTRASLASLVSGAAFSAQRAAQRDQAGALIDSRNSLDSVDLELSRANADLSLVEQRIAKDLSRLNQTSSPKDAQGIQSELETLAKRKSDLEDLALSILETKEKCEADFVEATFLKREIDEELAVLELENEKQIMKLRSGMDLTTSQRMQIAARVEPDFLALYEKKAARGIPVARLLSRECGACRITIGATALAELNSLPKDEIATCPDCQAILIR